MIKQTQQQLRHLNHAYIGGQLTYQEYRQKRGLMLDGLFEDVTVTEDFTPKTIPMTRSSHVPIEVTPKSSNTIIYIAIIMLIICIAIAASFIFLSPDSKEHSISSVSDSKAALTILVEDSFLTNNWTPEQLKRIASFWQQLSPSQKQIAQAEAWHKKLTYTLKSLASEQQALIKLDNSNAVKYESQINQLLSQLHQH